MLWYVRSNSSPQRYPPSQEDSLQARRRQTKDPQHGLGWEVFVCGSSLHRPQPDNCSWEDLLQV